MAVINYNIKYTIYIRGETVHIFWGIELKLYILANCHYLGAAKFENLAEEAQGLGKSIKYQLGDNKIYSAMSEKPRHKVPCHFSTGIKKKQKCVLQVKDS